MRKSDFVIRLIDDPEELDEKARARLRSFLIPVCGFFLLLAVTMAIKVGANWGKAKDWIGIVGNVEGLALVAILFFGSFKFIKTLGARTFKSTTILLR